VSRDSEHRGLLWVAVGVAILLTLLPLPYALEPLRPYWVALVFTYWTLETKSGITWVRLSLPGCCSTSLAAACWACMP
jgi:cell shape-determining protein MreD